MWMRAHQHPWTFGAFVATGEIDLKRTLLERLAGDGFRRAWLVVGGDRGFWREERLCLDRAGTWTFVVDTPAGHVEQRAPSRPELIAALEDGARSIIACDQLVEGTLHIVGPGLLLLGVDVEAGTMYGLAGYRELVDLFWRIRMPARMARGTDAPGTPGLPTVP